MASTVTPVSTPAPNAPPGAEVVDATGGSDVATPASAEAKTTSSAPSKFKIKGQEFSESDLEEALGLKARFSQELDSLSKREAALKERDSDFSSKDRAKALAALKKAGWSKEELEELSADVLEAHLRDADLTPEQKELAALKAEKAEREAAEKAAQEKAKADAEAKQAAEMTERFVTAYQEQFAKAMIDAGLPRTAHVLDGVIQIVLDANEKGWELTPAEATTVWRAQNLEPQRAVYEGMDAGQLRATLGDKVVDTIIKAHTDSLRQSVNKAPDAPEKRTSKGKAPPKPVSGEGDLDDIINNLTRKAYGAKK